MSKFYFTTFLAVFASFVNPQTLSDDCLECMCYEPQNFKERIFQASSDGCVMPDPVCTDGEMGEVCGPFAITRIYWMEAGWFGGEFHNCVEDWQCNEDTVRGYLAKFVTDANATCEDFARTHVGGPHGPHTDATLPYWHEVQTCLDNSTFTVYPEEDLD
ncbi:lysozyme-like [Macrobrachium nipponense]|uniref:lysozyme-like n=1 Tax=Macrobrachium nipponense TaxID=159736 RepID=UPI0030C88941